MAVWGGGRDIPKVVFKFREDSLRLGNRGREKQLIQGGRRKRNRHSKLVERAVHSCIDTHRADDNEEPAMGTRNYNRAQGKEASDLQ